jgi:hypothetical protein
LWAGEVVMRNGQRGEGRLGLIVALAIVGVGAFLGVKIIPVRIQAYEFRDFVEQECRTAALNNDDKKIAKSIMEKAGDLELPLERKNLKLRRTTSEMVISARFEKPIDLKVTTYNFKYEVESRAPLF